MATDIFIKIGDIKGESPDAKHKDEVEVLSWSWGVSQPGSVSGGGGAGKAGFSAFSFVHRLDKASPLLLRACATGERIKEAIVTHRKAGQGQQEFLIIKMNDVLVTSVQPAVSNSDGGIEAVSLQMGKVGLEYKPQKLDGSLDSGVFFQYDITANREG